MGYHHGNLRNALLRAAREALASGIAPADLSLRELARQAGVSPNAPYRHFSDRAHLLSSLAAAGYLEVTARLRSDSADGAASVGRTWAGYVAGEPQLARLMTSLVLDAGGSDELRDAVSGWIAAVADVVEAEGGETEPAELLRAAVGCWAAAHGLASLRSAGLLPGFDDWLLPDPGRLARLGAAAGAGQIR